MSEARGRRTASDGPTLGPTRGGSTTTVTASPRTRSSPPPTRRPGPGSTTPWRGRRCSPDVFEPLAISVATVDGDGRPNVRTVLMRFLDERGPGFVTALTSAKGRELTVTSGGGGIPDLAGDVPRDPVPRHRGRGVPRRGRAVLRLAAVGVADLGVGVAAVRADRVARRARGAVRRAARRPSPTTAATTTCRCPTSGAASGSCPTRSSSGPAGATGCTTGWCSPGSARATSATRPRGRCSRRQP